MPIIRFLTVVLVVLLLGLAGGGGLALCWVGLKYGFSSLERYSAVAHTGDIWKPLSSANWTEGQASLWLYTPHVAPGDRLLIEVGVYGGKRIAIDEVAGQLGTESFQHAGAGPQWKSKIVTGGSPSTVSDFTLVGLRIPADSRPGDLLDLQMDVRYTQAVAESGGFTNKQGEASLAVPIRVSSSRVAIWLRCLEAARAVLVFGLQFMFLVLLRKATRGRELPKWMEEHCETTVGLMMVLLVFAVTCHSYVGYWFFALPLLASVGHSSGWANHFLVFLWLLGPPLLLWRFSGRDAKKLVKAPATAATRREESVIPGQQLAPPRPQGSRAGNPLLDFVDQLAVRVSGLPEHANEADVNAAILDLLDGYLPSERKRMAQACLHARECAKGRAVTAVDIIHSLIIVDERKA